MSKKIHKKEEYKTEEVFQDLNEFALKTENFFEKNARYFAIGFGALILIAAGYFAYLQYVVKPNNQKANLALVEVQKNFALDSLDKALGGEGTGASYLANENGNLEAGKIAAMFAGNIEYKKGNYQKALDYFKKFDSDDEVMNALVKAAIGDCYVELNDNEKAMAEYKSGIEKTKNGGTRLTLVRKAVILAMETNKNSEALEILQQFYEKYPDTDQSGFVDSYLARLEAANGK